MASLQLHCTARAPSAARPAATARCAPRRAFQAAAAARRQPSRLRVLAEQASAEATSTAAEAQGNFVPILRPEDLPKGVRKEVRVEGISVLLFWYRNQIYAIESRSPAEGAYSEGFIRSKFTQDYAIECPATGSLFSLKDGSIVAWYPSNPVLRLLTPASTCRPLEIYPVKLTQDALLVDVSKSSRTATATRGGSDTSLENNNVYGLEPKVYVEGAAAPGTADGEGEATVTEAGPLASAATLTVTVVAVASAAVAGAATAIYFFAR